MQNRTSEVDTGARLGGALLAYVLGVMLVVTLMPFNFVWPERWSVIVGDDPFDASVGVLLFIPFGFVFRLARPRGSMLLLICNAILVSIAIETIQLFNAARESTLIETAANAAGALLGAFAFDWIARSARRTGVLIGWLGLEIPLMGLVYLLMPLLWVNALGAQGESLRTFMTIMIGAFGATILGGLQRHYFGPLRSAQAHETATFAAFWFVAGAFAMLLYLPLQLAGGFLMVAALCWLLGRRPPRDAESNRRFEGPLLRSAGPLYVGYLILLVIVPLFDGIGSWHGHFGFAEAAPSRVETARLLELCAAFTLMGYIAAELRGREESRYRDAFPRLIAWGVGLAIAAEVARGFDVYGASLARGALVVAACVYGGWLYDLQRGHVMSLVSQSRAASTTAA